LVSNHNHHEGIRRSSGSPPDVRNCILFANNADGNYLDYNDSGTTWNCCLTDPNNLSQPIADPPTDGRGNMKTYPGFAYTYPLYGYFHLNWDSPCRDRGDSGNYPNEQDMDGQDRVSGIKVDIGADEVTCEDTSASNDWNGDGVINYEDFAVLSHAWLSCDPNTYPPPKDPEDEYIWYVQRWGFQADLSQDGCVNLDDLVIFSEQTYENWLWTACWREDYWDVWGMKVGGGEGMLALGGAEEMKTMPMMIEGFEATSEQSVCEVDPEMLEQNIRLVHEEIEKAIETEEEGLNLENLFEIKVFLEEVLWDLQNGED
jgi:hypothetical protein